jgi:hypothetical protein
LNIPTIQPVLPLKGESPAQRRRQATRHMLETLATACATVGKHRRTVTASTVLLPVGPAQDLLTPERLGQLAEQYGVQIEVLDMGGPTANPCVRITREPDSSADKKHTSSLGVLALLSSVGGWVGSLWFAARHL